MLTIRATATHHLCRVGPEDSGLLRQFEECALAAADFGHRQHVQVAWTYLALNEPTEAIKRFVAGIKAFAVHHGATDLYHETITWAYLLLVNERIAAMHEPHTWPHFEAANPDLLARGKAVLSRYYRDETLASDRARAVFVLPDRLLDAVPV